MPNRIIKESIKRSPEIDRLSWFEEVVFYRLIVTADDYGRLDGRTVVLKNDLFPTKDTITKKAVEDAISKLVSVGLLIPYVDAESDMPYLMFRSWEKHQTIRNKYSKYPAPPDELLASCKHLQTNCKQTSTKCRYESESESESISESNQNHHDDDAREDFNTIQVYAANNLTFMSPGNLEELTGFVEILPDDVIRFAIDEACANGAPRWAYVSAILRGYVREGIKTVGDAKAAKDKRKTAAGAPQNPVTQTYQAHGYTDADYGEDFFLDLSKENGG